MNATLISYGANGFSVSLESEGFNETEQLKLSASVAHMADALSSPQFKEFCLNFRYQEAVTTGRFWNKQTTYYVRPIFRFNNGLTREQIYQKLINGSEVLKEGNDYQADIHLLIDRRTKRNVLGYTYANTSKQWVYNYFFSNGSVEDVAGNLAHEWVHKMGFSHEHSYNSLRDKSVPYAVGYFVREYKKELTAEQILAKIYA